MICLAPQGTPPHTAADTAHSVHSTQPALRPLRATPRVEDKPPQTRRPHSAAGHLQLVLSYTPTMLGGWVNSHREQQTIPQGQTSSPPKSFFTPTAKACPDQAALATSAEARGATHRARPRSTRLYTHSHELPALTALAQYISYSHSGIDEKRPTEKFV